MDIWLFVAGLVVLLAEIVMGRHRGIYRKEDFFVTGLCFVLNSAATRPLSGMMIGGLFALALPQFRNALSGLPLLPAYLAILLIADICFYWGHRLAHRGHNADTTRTRGLGWLWKLHRTHHSGKFMNVTLTARINIFWSFVVPSAWVYGLAYYLGLGQAAALAVVTVFGWNLLTHSHFRWDDPLRKHPLTKWPMWLLERVIVTPGIHHTHHGYGRDGRTYKNFAVMFSFIDALFGTLHIPQGRPHRYGLPGDNAHWAEEVFYPLVRISAKSGTASPGQETSNQANI